MSNIQLLRGINDDEMEERTVRNALKSLAYHSIVAGQIVMHEISSLINQKRQMHLLTKPFNSLKTTFSYFTLVTMRTMFRVYFSYPLVERCGQKDRQLISSGE